MGRLMLFFVSAVSMIAAFTAMVFLHGGWDAVAAGLALLSGLSFVVAAAALYAEGDGLTRLR